MPELPEVQTVVRELNRKLKNKTITLVDVRKPKVVAVGSAVLSPTRQVKSYQVQKFRKLVTGQRILSVKRRAKLLIFDLSGPWSLLVHLKMTGQFIYEDKVLRKKTGGKYRILNKLSAPLVPFPTKHTHVIFKFTDGSTLYYNDVRVFGYMKLVHDDEIDSVAELKAFGPEPLSKQFTLEIFCEKLSRRKKIAIKLALMDATLVAGIGNIYSDEILYHAKIAPDRRVDTLDNQDIKNIYKNIAPVLKIGIKYKGSSVGDFVRTDGQWGTMGRHHFVYGRKGQKCKRCGTIIKAIKLGGRTSCYCPKEQK